MTLTSSKLNAPIPRAGSIAQLEREVAEAEAALDAAEDAKRKADPEYIRAQVELKAAKLEELREAEEDAKQNLRLDLSVVEPEYTEALDDAIDAWTKYIEARDRLSVISARRTSLRTQARRHGLNVREDDTWATRLRGRRSVEERRTLQSLRERAQRIAITGW